MKTPAWIGLALLGGCGGEPLQAPPAAYTEIFARPDRISLAGPGAGRAIRLLGATAAGRLEPIDPEEVSWSSDALEVAAPTLRGVLAHHVGAATLRAAIGAAAIAIAIQVEEGPGPFAAEVLDHRPGLGGGFGAARLPDIVLGAPDGGGRFQGSTDVVSLGAGGAITLGFGDWIAFDGPGPDLIVFENAFTISGGAATFAEPASVEVALGDGAWRAYPCGVDAWPYLGCAGVGVVLAGRAHPELDPTDPDLAGGDAFDLAGVLPAIDRVRITDRSEEPNGADNSGFDLDAIALVHALPRDATALRVDRDRWSLRAGEDRILPRVDVLRAGGGSVLGIEAAIALDPGGGAVTLEGDVIRATRTGTASLRFTAGSLQTVVFIEVSP
ncbi:MAG: hypothetical protein IT384_00115 [Deltaproteobacteria bacterium]|nr:hypothetical protein [Deltaproteobacteria bacterium]